MEDEKIIDMYFARDEQAIQYTEAVYGKRLFTLANRILFDRQDSEESVNDTYLKAWTTIPPSRPAHFYAYLAKICRFIAFGKLDWNNAAKRKADVVSLTDEMEQCIPDNGIYVEYDAREIGRIITQFLESTSQESRVIFMRRYWFCDNISELPNVTVSVKAK